MTADTTAVSGSVHLSELVKQGDLHSILQKLHSQTDTPQSAIDWQDDDGRTAFHWAVGLRCWNVAEDLLRSPHSCSAVTHDKDGMTPLMSACAVDAPQELLSVLVDSTSKASGIECTDSSGNTALLLAASKGNVRALRQLLAVGANILHQNNRGQSALHRAVSRGMTDAVEEIVAGLKKLDRVTRLRLLNCADVEGNTPLHYAALENNQDLGQLLLRAGASRDAVNKQGKMFYEL